MKRYTNATFYTMRFENETYKEIITDKGYITHMGNDLSNINTDEVIDLEGHFVFPGFLDCHMHILGYGQKLFYPSLKDVYKKDEALKIIKKAYNGQTTLVEDYAPIGLTHHDLDQISSTQMIILRHQDYHSVTVNSKAIEFFKVEHHQGMVLENDAQKITSFLGQYDEQTLKKLFKLSVESLWAYGITGAHSDDLYYYTGFKSTLKVFKDMLPKMPFRTQLLVHHHVLNDYLQSGEPFLDVNPYLQMGPVKMFYDGTMGSKTAYLSAPYQGETHQGFKEVSPNDFDQAIQFARSHHLPVAVHVIGDQALVDICKLLIKYPAPKGLYDRIIHAEWMNDEALELLKKIPVFIDAQPQFLSSDMPWALDLFSKKPKYQFPWKTMMDHQLLVGFSSDAPVETPNPLLGIYDAIVRKSKHDNQICQPNEATTMFEAIKAYTKTPAMFTYHQNRGTLDIGHIADFTVFKKDLFGLNPEYLKEPLVAMTIVDDKIVYQANK
jgi:predicted amidohydrolase YtcJ